MTHSIQRQLSSHEAAVMFAWCFGGGATPGELGTTWIRIKKTDAHARSTMFRNSACAS